MEALQDKNSRENQLEQMTLEITGMTCTTCARRVEEALQGAPGVVEAQVNFAVEKAYIQYESGEVVPAELLQAVEGVGYEARVMDEETENITLKISGMTCSSCAQRIGDALNDLDGVQEASVNYATESASISYRIGAASPRDFKETVENAGYQISEDEKEEEGDRDQQKVARAARRMWFGIAFAAPIMILMMIDMFVTPIPYYFPLMLVLGFPPIVIAGWETHRATWRALKSLSPNMDTLVTMGSLVPYLLTFLGFIWQLYSFVEMAASIMTFHLVGRFLETKAKGRASQAIKKLLEMEARTARILVDGEEKEVPIEDLQVGDVMIVRPGEKIPTDGVVIEGRSTIDESMATGESIPVERGPEDEVIGSTINKQGRLKVRATKVGKDTFLSQVIKMVEEAQGTKVPIQEFADRVTGYFVPGVIVIAISAFVMWMLFPDFFIGVVEYFSFPWSVTGLPPVSMAILATIAVLVISCPCALGLATPTAIMVGSGKGAENGVLLRSGEAIQTMKEVELIAFDKTGTITRGHPEVTDVIPAFDFGKEELLYYTASLENASEHPLGEAIVEKAHQQDISLTEARDFTSVTGKGVKGQIEDREVLIGSRRLMKENGIEFDDQLSEMERLEDEAKTAMLVAIDGKLAGIVAVADTLKEDSARAIAEIEKMGIRTAMITGDNQRTAEAIASKVGISHVVAEVLPEGKVDEIKKLQDRYGTVAMVGDGINDAPSLKQANVGIAIGTGTDIAIEAADLTLVRGDLSAVIAGIKLSHATFNKIRQNYFWAWFYNGIAIPAAYFGLIHPIIGAIAMFTSSINVVLNSTRLKKINIEPDYVRSGETKSQKKPATATP